jgi:hypothetical protein
MHFIKRSFLLLAVALLVLPDVGFAQYKHRTGNFFSHFRNKYRYELAAGIYMPSGEFYGVQRHVDAAGSPFGDTTITRPLSGTGFGASIGVTLPFKGTGHISHWAVDVQVQANYSQWKDLNQIYHDNGTFTKNATPLNATTQQVAVPLGILYKIGTDAILSKRLDLGASFGAGFIPQVNFTSLEGVTTFNPGYGWGLSPFLKGEFAAFTGICWKLRFMYTFSNIKLLDIDKRIPNVTDGPFSMTLKSALIVQFVVMPFSRGWHETNWWNTYDTYNQFDRFN